MPPGKMTATASGIRFQAKLLRPVENTKGGSWSFVVLPKAASARLPSRSVEAVEGTLNGFRFYAMLQPDGQKGHWLKVERKLREGAAAVEGDLVSVEMAPTDQE